MAENQQEPSVADPFDLNSLRTPPDYRTSGKTATTRHKIRTSLRAPKDKFIRVHPFDISTGKWCFDSLMYTHDDDESIEKTTYIVPAGTEAFEVIEEKLRRFLIVAAITRKNALFLWELVVPDPDADARSFDWHQSKLQCAEEAVEKWVSVYADLSQGCYNTNHPLEDLPGPRWPTVSFEELMQLAYEDRIIRDRNHPVIKEILGIE
jgi:hypothetical protein